MMQRTPGQLVAFVLIAAAMVGIAAVSLSAGPAPVITPTPDLMLRSRYPATARVVTELDNARRIEVLEYRIASLEATIRCQYLVSGGSRHAK